MVNLCKHFSDMSNEKRYIKISRTDSAAGSLCLWLEGKFTLQNMQS